MACRLESRGPPLTGSLQLLKAADINFNAQARLCWNCDIPVAYNKGFRKESLAESHVFLAEEIWRARSQLETGGQGDRSQRAVWGDADFLCFRHGGEFTGLENPADV